MDRIILNGKDGLSKTIFLKEDFKGKLSYSIEKNGKSVSQGDVNDGKIDFDFTAWSPSIPELYRIKISESTGEKILDIGFRVLKCDSSNMKEVYYNPADYTPDMFDNLTDNIKSDRTPEDLLFQVMLDLGILISSKIQSEVLSVDNGVKYTYYNVADNYLIACFDENITDEVITEIAKKKPYYFVMRDSSLASDSVAVNFEQIFKTYSPDTVRKVL